MKRVEIIDGIAIKIDEQEVLRYLGYQKNSINEIDKDIRKIIKEEIAYTYSLLESKGIYQFLDIVSISENGIIITKQEHKFKVNKEIASLFKNAEYLVLAVVTIGFEIEKSVMEKFNEKDYIKAMALDAAGTVAVKTVGKWLNHFIEEKNSQVGLKFSRYFEPGSGDWEIREQKQIFNILKPEKIGVTLSSSFMMYPSKSLSWIRGAGHNLINSYRDEFSCQYCLLSDCPFRKQN
jgi:cobalamin-dependent methionine synthase I